MGDEKSRICIVTTRNIFDAPCLDKYGKLIDEPFDIIYWDRCGIEENCGAANYFKFNKPLRPESGKFSKLKAYIGFAHFVNRILKAHDYDKLIVFPTQAGWLIKGKLCRKYSGRYILDIRDYAGENNPFFFALTKKIVEHSGITCITSPAYRKFLPDRKYVISHNVQHISKELIDKYRSRKRDAESPIVLSFIGSVRFIEQQKQLIMKFRNDPRFHLKYIGRGSEQLADFCKANGVNNVTLVGRFEREQLPQFYMDTDMAINVYGNHDPYLDYALSNKLYSAAMMGMPILVSPGTYMADIVTEYGIGFEFDVTSLSATDDLNAYINSLNKEKMIDGCTQFMHAVESDEKRYTSETKEFLRN